MANAVRVHFIPVIGNTQSSPVTAAVFIIICMEQESIQ